MLTHIIIEKGWRNHDEAAETAADWIDRFVIALKRRQADAHALGSYVQYTFNSADQDYIQGASFIEPYDDEGVIEAKRRRANTLPITTHLDALTPLEFEVLCGGVLRFFGVSSPTISRRSADQGIDFYGQAPFAKILAPERLPAGVEKDLRVWIVGQAKHYSKVKVSTKDLRELIGSTELAKSKVFAGKIDPLDDLSLRICDPIFYMIITSGAFTIDSRELIDRSGIIAMDGLQLSQLLADNGVGDAADGISKEQLLTWLHQEPAPSLTVSN